MNPHPVKREHSKQFYFDVQLNWLEKNKGILSANDVKGTIYVATPVQFGGEGQEWSPEHLLLSSVSSCFMTTFLVFAKKLGFTAAHIECEASGQIELVDGRFQFTQIDFFPKITVTEKELESKAGKALEKTQKYCLISNSLKCPVNYHSEVLLQTVPVYTTNP